MNSFSGSVAGSRISFQFQFYHWVPGGRPNRTPVAAGYCYNPLLPLGLPGSTLGIYVAVRNHQRL